MSTFRLSAAALSTGLGACSFLLLPTTARTDACSTRDRLLRDIEGLASRVETPDAPLLVVVGGVTGAGKSTLVNTLAGRVVATTGVKRPTTGDPTLVCHPADLGWFDDDRVLPRLARHHLDGEPGAAGSGEVLWLAPVDAIPSGVAFLDAPDSDSISDRNRHLADLLLDAADVWLWMTTQGKYADEASMTQLRRARDRGAALAVVLSHLDPEHAATVEADLVARLDEEGLAGTRVFTVPRVMVVDQQLPEVAVFDLRQWLWSLADPDRRTALREQTVQGAIAALPAAIEELLDLVAREERTAQSLIGAASERFDAAADEFARMLQDGHISMRDQVLASWVDFLGTGRFQRFIAEAPGRIRSAARSLLAGRLGGQQRLEEAVTLEATDAVAGRLRQVADIAAGEVAQAWLADPVGREILAEDDSLHRASSSIEDAAADMVTAWEQELRDLLDEVGAMRKVRAQWASNALNALVASLMIVVFASTGGLSGAEIGLAGVGATVSQLLLERLLGEHNVRWLVARAKESLLERVRDVLADERRRYVSAVADRAPDPEKVTELRELTTQLAQGTA